MFIILQADHSAWDLEASGDHWNSNLYYSDFPLLRALARHLSWTNVNIYHAWNSLNKANNYGLPVWLPMDQKMNAWNKVIRLVSANKKCKKSHFTNISFHSYVITVGKALPCYKDKKALTETRRSGCLWTNCLKFIVMVERDSLSFVSLLKMKTMFTLLANLIFTMHVSVKWGCCNNCLLVQWALWFTANDDKDHVAAKSMLWMIYTSPRDKLQELVDAEPAVQW